MKKLILALIVVVYAFSLSSKTLVVYYSYTNNIERVVNELKTQIECDVVEIEPAEKGLDYAANNYAIGSAQIAAIRNNPNDASSYPAIEPVNVDLTQYDTVIVGAPLWWSRMAAPLQTFLFNYGQQMAGKNIGVIASSASSDISGVVADAKRLIPDGNFLEPSLWIRSSQTSNAKSLIEQWLKDIDYSNLTAGIGTIDADEYGRGGYNHLYS
ncbi:MAG: flavodoxin [Bacteroides sp.]|nr:flavodoxin [Bacteroides sp.]